MQDNKISLVFVLVICAVVKLGNQNLILSVSQSSYQVKTSTIISIAIRTSVSMTTLDIVLSNEFTISNPNCRVNDVVVACNKITPSTGTNVIVRYTYNFLTLTNYTLSFNATNPSYASSFPIQGFNGATIFSGSKTVQIVPKQIACSMTSSSNVVNQFANATFLIGVSTMASGTIGKISMTISGSIVLSVSPKCKVDGSQSSCTLGTIFIDKLLSLDSVNIGARTNGSSLNLLISSIKNSQYNSSSETITILIKDSLDNEIESCIVLQPAPTILQQSSFLAIQGWNSLVGSVSNVQFLLTPYSPPSSSSGIVICLVIQDSVTINVKTPATQVQSTSNGYKFIKVSNVTYISQVFRFNTSFQNPSSVIPLSLSAYLMTNTSLFSEQKELGSGILALLKQHATVSVVATNPKTLVSSILNLTITTPIKLTGGFYLTTTIQYGFIICSNLGFSTTLPNTNVSSCSATQLVLKTSTDIASSSSYWFIVNYQTYTSIISNTASVEIQSILRNPIMNGSSLLSIGISSPLFNITSSNSTFTSISNYTFVQSNVTALNSSVKRSCSFTPPIYVKITDTTSVSTSATTSSVVSFNLDLSANIVNVVIQGTISIKILNIRNPTHYLGGRDWKINCSDLSGYASSSSVSTHTPQYSPARSSIKVALSNQTIQQSSNATITFQPLLQYSLTNPPLMTTVFSASSIENVSGTCPSCIRITSTKFTMPYYEVVMKPIIQIINNRNPFGNSVDFTISISDFVYEVGSVSYVLNPLQFQFTNQFQGQYANLGRLIIRVTSTLSTELTLKYTGIANVFSSDVQCEQCNSTYLQIAGLVGYFETANVIIEGYSNDILYARGVVVVQYTCSEITGCQICETINSTLQCSRCFSNSLTRNYLLYSGICFSICPAMTYQNGAVCSSCPDLCYRCNPTVCLECVTAYYIYQQSCVSQCPPLYIKNATHCLPRPVICPTNCIDCPSDYVCQKCDAGFYLLDNLCYTSCPTSYLPNEPEALCELYIPPKQTDYFPFAFFLASIVALVLLRIIKFFEKRSLIVGNFISFASLMEIGAIILMISYTFISISTEPKRWINNNRLLMQALIFIIVLTKVTLNLTFMAYFLRKISNDQNFQSWLNKSHYNNRLYIVLLVLSSIFSFQIMRIIYCRLLGLQIFFGRFNTSLIFKPINYFSLAYIVPGGGLIVMAVFDIIMQNGYRTSIFYSSIEVILIEILLLVSCIFQGCRSDREYFDFQLYKVENESENANSASKINIMEQQQVGGSINQMLMNSNQSHLNPVGYDPDEVGSQTAGKIIRNKRWREVKKKQKNLHQIQQTPKDAENTQDFGEAVSNENDIKIQTSSQVNLGLSSHFDFQDKSKQKSLFRKKILQDWQKLQKKLPHVTTHKKLKKITQRNMFSKSPIKKKQKLTKVSSLQKIEGQTKLAIPSFKNKKKLKNYFYKISKQNENKTDEQANKDVNVFDNIDYQTAEDMKNIDFINGAQVYEHTDLERQDGEISEIQNNQIQQSFEKSLLELKKDFKANRYDDFDNSIIQEDEQQKDEISKTKNLNLNSEQFGAQKRKIKKRNINKQTEAVYLQRLVSSSQNHRPKALRREKLQDF